jgi:hypothetical protein
METLRTCLSQVERNTISTSGFMAIGSVDHKLFHAHRRSDFNIDVFPDFFFFFV